MRVDQTLQLVNLTRQPKMSWVADLLAMGHNISDFIKTVLIRVITLHAVRTLCILDAQPAY